MTTIIQTTLDGYKITTQFGAIDTSHKIAHQGIDLAMPIGTPVKSVGDGIVTSITDEGSRSFGKAIYVHLNDGHDVIYGHLSDFKVIRGQQIHTGDVIALSGNTGLSTGAHLHLQISEHNKNIDPLSYLNANPLISTQKHIPWWDLKGHTIEAADALKEWIITQSHMFGLWVHDVCIQFLDVAIPTVACIGIIWWMCPFFPRSDKAPKLTGTALIVYMFYTLAKGG